MGANKLQSGRRLGKYRLRRRIGVGALSTVWRAYDTVEGITVAIKIPDPTLMTGTGLKEFQAEARLVATLDHPNILKIKNADSIDGHFLLVYDLGQRSLHQEMRRVLPVKRIFAILRDVLAGLAYAHDRGIIHRDIKPENIIRFGDDRFRLADFGISRLTTKTIMTENPTGTLGYMAPEQAYGRATLSSDTFSVGILAYELLTGDLPDWPFKWPFPKYEQVVKRAGHGTAQWIHKATTFQQQGRFSNATEMLNALNDMERSYTRRLLKAKQQQSGSGRGVRKINSAVDRAEGFAKRYRRVLELEFSCVKCKNPISEYMQCCPWCGHDKNDFSSVTRFPYFCSDCKHGVYGDWFYCPWCYAEKFTLMDFSKYREKRYLGRCANARCGGLLMPFMHYCPWCHRKRRKPWKLSQFADGCPKCHWSVSRADWKFCPWCRHWPLV